LPEGFEDFASVTPNTLQTWMTVCPLSQSHFRFPEFAKDLFDGVLDARHGAFLLVTLHHLLDQWVGVVVEPAEPRA
jgi:hypothetical protein